MLHCLLSLPVKVFSADRDRIIANGRLIYVQLYAFSFSSPAARLHNTISHSNWHGKSLRGSCCLPVLPNLLPFNFSILCPWLWDSILQIREQRMSQVTLVRNVIKMIQLRADTWLFYGWSIARIWMESNVKERYCSNFSQNHFILGASVLHQSKKLVNVFSKRYHNHFIFKGASF
jgi:hypothetical protein